MKNITLIFGLILIASPSFAADKSNGCGLGWYVMKENSLVSSTLRETTNMVFWNQTFGMTSGTSNCAKHSFIENDKRDLHFLEANYDTLLVDAALGKGAFLSAFSNTLDCAPQIQGHFNSILQQNYKALFPEVPKDFSLILKGIRNAVKSDPIGAMSCQLG